MNIAIIGTGAYGLALALAFAKNDCKVKMWTESNDVYQEFKNTKKLKSILDVLLPDNISVTDSYEVALNNADLICLVTASKYIDIVCKKIEPFYKKGTPICIATKGIEESTEELLSNIVKKVIKTNDIAVISGPTFAVDIANNEPVALSLGATNNKTEEIVRKSLANDKLKLRPTKDIIGIQICGAIKNVIAIAAGILNGLGYTDSTQAFLINESLHDIKDIIYYLGGNPKTILSFAGVGDLMLTCTSTKSRNFRFGYTIGHTKDQDKIAKFLQDNTVEGYYTLETIYRLLKKKDIDIPLISTIYDIIYNEEDPNMLVNFLISKA